MKALVYRGVKGTIEYSEKELNKASDDLVTVRIKSAALNRRDVWITQDMYPGIVPGVTLGSDGAGIADGHEVIINPNINWGNNPSVFGKGYNILGMPSDGTFAEKVAVKPDRLVDKPDHLTFAQAAALPLAGLTAFRALFTKCDPQPGEKVLISGVGGGVALTACQFSIAAGLETYVTSGSEDKIQKAIALGAAGGINYRNTDWHKELLKITGGVDAIIDSAGGEGFAHLLKVCNPGARIAIYGGTRGAIQNLSPQLLFWRQIEIHGSTMGNDEEFIKMVTFVNDKKVVPTVDSIFELHEGQRAFDRMANGLQFGKIVLNIN